MSGKIDFIVCESGGAWYLASMVVPDEVAVQSNDVLSEWAKRRLIQDEPDIVFVGVYWRDDFSVLTSGITQEAAMRRINDSFRIAQASHFAGPIFRAQTCFWRGSPRTFAVQSENDCGSIAGIGIQV